MEGQAEKEPPPTPRSKLETLPREDLIRFAKKQAITAKQLREKNEELESKLRELSIVPSRQTSDAVVQTIPTSENQLLCRLQEETQWLRMALTMKPNRSDEEERQIDNRDQQIDDQESAIDNRKTPIQKSDNGCQTLSPDFKDAGTENDFQKSISSISIDCQTDDEPIAVKSIVQQEKNPDAMREAKMQLQLLANELDEARRQLANQSLLKLEMDDTEKSFVKLQTELRQSADLLASTQNENQSMTSEIQSLQKRLSNLEIEKEKAEKKSMDAESKIDLLRQETSIDKLEMNEMEIKLAKTVEELERMKLDTASDVSSTQRRLCDLQNALDETRRRLEKSENERGAVERRLDELNDEYRAYRTRVHSVLKQERTTSSSIGQDKEDNSTSDQNRTIDQQVTNSLREQLEKAKQLYETSRADLERVREQHDQLYERHRMLRTHADEAEAQWKFELESMRADAARLSRLHAEQIRTLTTDKRDMQRDFERRLDESMSERRERVGQLEQRVAELERELNWSTQQLAEYDRKANKSEKESEAKDDNIGRRRTHAESVDYVSPRPLMERKPGEGAENVDAVKKASMAASVGGDFSLPFERQRSLEDLLGDQQSIHSFDAASERAAPKDEANSMVVKLRHLSDLLSESEANNSRLSEQIKLLKDEIRRLERNNERSEHVANAEYLKNIVLQFLNPSMQDRRQRLLPVLTTLLRLSPEEVTALKDATPDNAAAPNTTSSTSSGWGGYIHRWSGLN